jgi:3-isopropylmalate/(R)-2-methylmalate dehydratase large subunit
VTREGEIVTCRVDLAMFHDSSARGGSSRCWKSSVRAIWDKSRVVLVMDHYVPEADDDARRIVRIARDWARDQRCRTSTTARASATWWCRKKATSGRGCSASVAIRIRPPAARSAAYMFGIGATEMLGVVVTGEIWLQRAAHAAHALEGAPGRWRQRQGHDAGTCSAASA